MTDTKELDTLRAEVAKLTAERDALRKQLKEAKADWHGLLEQSVPVEREHGPFGYST